MTVVGSRFGNDNHYATGKGKGFTIICNDCGILLTSKDFTGAFCIFCEYVGVITCSGCKQEVHNHDNLVCTREINYVQGDEGAVGELRSPERGK